jgi:hypothetical protein
MTDGADNPAAEAFLTPEQAEELRKGVNHPGKLPGEGQKPSQGTGGGDDVDSAAIGSGPSGGA